MSEEVREPWDLLPLTPAVLNILLALADEERHGYGIMREVEARTGGGTRLGPGTLYGSIKRMLADGLIEESDERPDPESTTSVAATIG
jgi:DNA-binding PadR family transcriptional regulator